MLSGAQAIRVARETIERVSGTKVETVHQTLRSCGILDEEKLDQVKRLACGSRELGVPRYGHVLEIRYLHGIKTTSTVMEFALRIVEATAPAQAMHRHRGVSREMSESDRAALPGEKAGDSPTGSEVSLPAAVPGADRDPVARRSSVSGVEPVDTAVFCPPRVARDCVFLVQVFLYLPRDAAKVDRQAWQADEAAERRGTYSLPLDVPPGTRVDLHLEMPGLSVPEPDAALVWRGGTTAAQFEVEVPADAVKSQVVGRVRMAVAGVPAGTLRFLVGLTAAGSPMGAACAHEVRARRYRRGFASYSSQDRAEVLRRVQAFRIAGVSVFQDILTLDPGERWERALFREIDQCDVFLLFWSRAAAASEWVGKEIDYALARKQGDEERPPDIQPVPIEGPPIVPPPEQLKGLHFNDALLAHIRAAETAETPRTATDEPHPSARARSDRP